MPPTSRSMSSRRMRYWSTRSRDGVATCTKTASSTLRAPSARRSLTHRSRSEIPLCDALAKRPHPCVDPLGVVESVDAEEDLGGVAQLVSDLRGARLHRL